MPSRFLDLGRVEEDIAADLANEAVKVIVDARAVVDGGVRAVADWAVNITQLPLWLNDFATDITPRDRRTMTESLLLLSVAAVLLVLRHFVLRVRVCRIVKEHAKLD